jgi:cyclopropane-fatty-acyl-phospholipid synthase
MAVAEFVAAIFNGNPPFRIEAYDGSVAGAPDAPLTVRFLRKEALTRALTRPGELGISRAYVAGDVELDGDLTVLFDLQVPPVSTLLKTGPLKALLKETGVSILKPIAPPSIEARQKGLLHSKARDSAAISHHYDVSNDFYRIILGPSMVYSCAVFDSPEDSLEDAQIRKVDLIARKLDLAPGMRLLDVGCGWGTMAIHAAKVYGCSAVGVTLSEPQQRRATERAEEAGVGDLVEFRVQDFRDVTDGPFDAISSIGMFEHVGRRSMELYIRTLYQLLKPGGRFLNHAIGRPATRDAEPNPTRLHELTRQISIAAGLRGPSRVHSPFIERYVFPDGELHEVGTLVSMFQAFGFEVRHLEGLREHYALTLHQWVRNLEEDWDTACAQVGEERARVWRLYMAGSAAGFEKHELEIHQVLCVRPEHGSAQMPLRPMFEPVTVDRWVNSLV